MKKDIAIVMIMSAVLMVGCTKPDTARRALESAGYTNVDLKGHAYFVCSDDDTFADKFEARGMTGVKVTGAVCSGWFKGSTIRLD